MHIEIPSAVQSTTEAPARTLRRVADLPGPRRWPLLGNLPQLKPVRIHRVVEDWSRQYGGLFRIYFGRTPVLVVADPALIAGVLRDRPDGFRRPLVTAQVSDEMNGRPGLFLAEGAAWRDQRRMVMPAFAPHAIKAYFPSLRTVALRLQRRWQQAAAQQREIALNDDLKRYTVDIIAGLALGTEINTIDGGDSAVQHESLQHHMDVLLKAVARRSIAPFPYWRYFKLPVDRQIEHSTAALSASIDGFIATARQRMAADPERRQRPGNLLEAMIAAADEGGSGVDDIAVAGNVSTMLMAGEDTTANSLGWLLYLLQRHPDALRRAQDEVLRLAPDPAAFSIEQLDALDYLDACVQEAMRLKPVAPFLPLQALRDTAVGDVMLPKDGLLWCVMRRDSVADAHFPQAQSFLPERWLADGREEPQAAAARRIPLPFGAGLRTCPGRYLALLEIKIAMAMLLSSFELESVNTADGREAEEQMGFVMAPPALTMRLRLRQG
jgi:cytochrome P450